jgi:hypothetical protein
LPATPLLPVIRQSLRTRGLWSHSGVDSSAILQALESQPSHRSGSSGSAGTE